MTLCRKIWFQSTCNRNRNKIRKGTFETTLDLVIYSYWTWHEQLPKQYLTCFRNVSSKKQHRQREMSMNVLNLEQSARSTPCNSPGSRRSSNSAAQSPTINSGPGLSSVEIHEIFEPNDLHENWQETFLTRSCYVWVPKRQRQTENSSLAIDNKSSSSKPVLKDVTEEMLPLEIENSREANIVVSIRQFERFV